MVAKNNIELSMDASPIAETSGIIRGTLNAIESTMYVNAFVNYGLDVLKKEFDKDFTIVAMGNPNKYHHVFEWDTLKTGTPIPLYRIRKQGQGQGRELSFYFIQSRRYVPVPKNLDLKGHELRRHIFRWKAMVMELGSPVHIVPREAKKLLIPDDSKKGYYFANATTVKNPGGQATTGAFTGFWTTWFGTTANQVTEKKIVPRAEQAIKREVEEGLRTVRSSTGSSTKTYSLNASVAERAMQAQEKRMEASVDKYFDNTNNE